MSRPFAERRLCTWLRELIRYAFQSSLELSRLISAALQTDIIRILLRNGAQVDARAREQQTPLHIASRLGNVDIVMLLLQHGAQVDAVTKDMYTALHIAAKEGQDEVKDLVAKKLMDHIDTVYLMQLFWIRHQEYFI